MLRTLKAVFLFALHVPYKQAPGWTDGDARNLSSFFQSETGEKLKLILSNQVVVQNDLAVGKSTVRACSFSKGFKYGVTLLQSLALYKISEPPARGVAGEFDHLTP